MGRLAARLPERLALDLARFAGDAVPGAAGAPSPAGRALAAGDAAEVWARLVAPATGLDHLDPSTLLVLDEPGDLADAADFLWRQAEERHAELVENGRAAARLAAGATCRRATGRPASTGRGPWS